MKHSLICCAVYMGLALASLAVAAGMSVPKLYYPLFGCGLALALLAIKLFTLLLQKCQPSLWQSGVALTMAILSLALLYFLPDYYWNRESPEPVRLKLLWLSQLQGASVVASIFAALDAKSDRISAIIAFILAVISLFLMGYNGVENLMQKNAAAAVIVAIVCLVGERIGKKD